MPTSIRFAEGPPGNAAVDFDDAWKLARSRRDRQAETDLRDLMFGYLNDKLRRLSPAKLLAYLGERQVWRDDGVRDVYKTPGEPCVAFTSFDFGVGPELVVLGVCYQYPGSEQDWWNAVIEPRLKAL